MAGIRAWQAEQRAKRNFDVAGALVTDIARGLRNVEGMRAEARKKIFDQVSPRSTARWQRPRTTSNCLACRPPCSRNSRRPIRPKANSRKPESTVKSLEIRLQLAEMGKAISARRMSSTLERIGELKLGAGDDAGAFVTFEKILDNRMKLAAADQATPTTSATWPARLATSAI